MGWAAGSDLAEDIWKLVRPHIPDEQRQQLAFKIYDRFCDEDADAWEERMSIVQDADVWKPDEEGDE